LIKIVIIKDSDGNILSKSEIEIDNNGNIIEYKVYDDSETLYYCYKSTFDNKSQEIERKILGGYNEGLYTYKYDSFDSKGNWTKKIEYKDGEIESLEIRKIEY
jgi:hypothetical protein